MDKRIKADLEKYRTKSGGTIIHEDLDFLFVDKEIIQTIRMMHAGASLMDVSRSMRPLIDPIDAYFETVLLVSHLQRKKQLQMDIDVRYPYWCIEPTK